MKDSKGYTLIELLIVMIILVTVGLIVATILVSALRGTNKATTVDNVRNNGNYAILQMSKMIEFAQNFIGVGTDGNTYSTTCPTPSPLPKYTYIKVRSFDNQDTVFSCSTNPNSPIASNGASFVNPNEVNVTTCYFTCQRSSISQLPVIGIYFSLSQKSNENFFEKKASIDFQTSVVMRNLNK